MARSSFSYELVKNTYEPEKEKKKIRNGYEWGVLFIRSFVNLYQGLHTVFFLNKGDHFEKLEQHRVRCMI